MTSPGRRERNETTRALWERNTEIYDRAYVRGVTCAVNAWDGYSEESLRSALGKLLSENAGTMDVSDRAWHDAGCDTIKRMLRGFLEQRAYFNAGEDL